MANRTKRTKRTQNGTPAKHAQDEPKQSPEDKFLAALRNSGNIRAACAAAGLGRSTVYEWQKADEAFAKRMDDAIEDHTDFLEGVAITRAVGDRAKGIEPSDMMLKFMLSSRRPSKYRESYKHEHSGPGGGKIPVDISGSIERIYGSAAPAAGDEG